MDINTLLIGITYTNNKIKEIQTGIKSISVNGNKLIFTLSDDSKIETDLTGLSDNNFTNEYKSKLENLDESILSKFSYVDNKLLYDGKELGGNIQVALAKDIKISNENFKSTNVEDALTEVFTNVGNGKKVIASAITDKGVKTSDTDEFNTMALNILKIVACSSSEVGGVSITDIMNILGERNSNFKSEISQCSTDTEKIAVLSNYIPIFKIISEQIQYDKTSYSISDNDSKVTLISNPVFSYSENINLNKSPVNISDDCTITNN